MSHTIEIDLNGRTITLETGKVAKQANGSVVVRSGDSVVLVSACANEEPKPGVGFFPLTVDYREYTYAAGRFPGGFIKREGRPSEKEVLTCRMIDRPVRPLFPEGFSCETQIIGMVLSADPECDPSTLAMIGAGAALAISDIPFEHVLGAVRVGRVDGKLIANPTYAEAKLSSLNITVSATDAGIVMVEAGASEASEEEVVEAIEFAHEACRKIVAGVRELVAKAGKPKRAYVPPPINEELFERISVQCRADLSDALNTEKHGKLESYRQVAQLRKNLVDSVAEEIKVDAGKLFDLLKERIF
ncbi:MAG: polyribonucleotide nucleotidyltransferase, partial [Acidobacteria bacterium]|nr:polyribonucleotide nucleotidyltransferase [Acidobacteriota bacterium]